MNRLSDRIPRAGPVEHFYADPLRTLLGAHVTHGNLVVLRESGAIFSRAADGAGVVAVFGAAQQRTVLTDLDTFGMPISAAQRLRLPPNLVSLNRGLHSLPRGLHSDHRRLLAALLNDVDDERRHAIERAVEEHIQQWSLGSQLHLIGALRKLMLAVAGRLMFGAAAKTAAGLLGRMQAYFELRRELSSPAASPSVEAVANLIALGQTVDAELRDYVRWCRRGCGDGIVADLSAFTSGGQRMSEDDVVGHSNVLFISSTEPMAVALGWLFVALSQRPDLRDLVRAAGTEVVDGVIHETLRLVPPNAFMVRTTKRPTRLGGFELPSGTEVVLCPFVSHRDPEHFGDPDAFRPDRWDGWTPEPYVYFPFGGGGHHCVGRSLALGIIKSVLKCALARFDLVLSEDQGIDWRLHIIFMPSPDPICAIHAAGSVSRDIGGRLRGPVSDLLGLDIYRREVLNRKAVGGRNRHHQ